MDDRISDRREDDERFAADLERKHDQLIRSKRGLPPEIQTPEGENEDDRVQSAMHVLRLLEELKPASCNSAIGRAETVEDPSTIKQLDIGQQSKTRSPVDALIPNLESLGRFKIIQQIGRGGYGIVVRAHDPHLDRDVALKIPRFETALSSESRKRFVREAKAAAALNHPGIVAVFETGSEQGVDFIVNEFVDGENLATLLARGLQFTHRQSAELIASLADAIEHAHQRGVLHRDLKPSNILMQGEDRDSPKITDFGLASIVNQQDFTQTGAVVGTPAYMSPEQATGDKRAIRPATDVYGLGTILYELLTGRPPFADLPLIETLRAITEQDPIYPRSLDPTIDRDLEAICLKCLEKDPNQRYLSAQALQADLRRFLNNSPVLARRITRIDRVFRWARRNPVLASLSSALVLALSLGLIVAISLWQTSEGHRRVADQNQTMYRNKAQELENIVDQMFGRIRQMPELGLNGMEPIREKMLLDVNTYYTSLLSEAPADTRLLQKNADTMLRLAKIKSSLSDFSGAIDIASDVVNSIPADPQAAQIQQRIDGLILLARVYSKLGQNQQRQQYYDEALEMARHAFASKSDPDEQDRIEFAISLSDAADLAALWGLRTKSNELALESISIWENLQSQKRLDDETIVALSRSFGIAAKTHAASENRTLARQYSQQAIELLEQNLDELTRVSPEVQYQLADAFYVLGASYRTELPNAMPNFDRALSIISALAEDHPLVPRYQQQIGSINYQRGLTHYVAYLVDKMAPDAQEQLDSALEIFADNIEFLNRCRAQFYEYQKLFEPVLTSSNTVTGLIYGERKQYEQQLQSLAQSLSLAQKLYDESGTPQLLVNVQGIHSNMAFPLIQLERYPEAIEKLEFANAGLEPIIQDDPDNGTVARYLSGNYENLALALAQIQQHQQALDAYRKSMAYYREGQQETMMGREAEYLVRVKQMDEAREKFDRFTAYQTDHDALPKLVAHASHVVAAIDQLPATERSETSDSFRQYVAHVAVDALSHLDNDAEFDDSRMKQLLTKTGMLPLQATDVFQSWQESRSTPADR